MPDFVEPARVLSVHLLNHVRYLYEQSYKANPNLKREDNWATLLAIPAYMTAAAAVEAFINESFLSLPSQGGTNESPIWDLDSTEFEKFEKMEVPTKVILLPKLAYGTTLKKDENPYRDLVKLIKLRNALMHYKFRFDKQPIHSVVENLTQQKIFFERPAYIAVAWLDLVASTRGIRWAHNVAVQTMAALVKLMPHMHYNMMINLPLVEIGPDEWKGFIPKA